MRSLVPVVLVGILLLSVAPFAQAGDPPPQVVVDLVDSKLSALGEDSTIVDAVREENRQNKTLDQIKILDEGWRMTDGTPEFMRGWIDSDCGRRLQEIKSSAPYYTILWVTDDTAANVAMSDKVPAYWHGEDPCFVRAFNGGSGAVFVGEVESDSIGRQVVEVCVPVVGHGIAIGVLHAVVDIYAVPN
jgi:hypothetical protein